MLKRLAAGGLAAALLIPATAGAATAPSVASRMTEDLARDVTFDVGFKEGADKDRWPVGARVSVANCKVVSRRKGSCDYTLDAPKVDPDTGLFVLPIGKACRRHVVVTIKKRTHRVKSRVKKLGCETY